MGLMTKAPMPLVCHPHQKHSDTTETSLLDGLPRTEWVLRAGLGTSQVLEIITQQQPWVVGMGLAKIPNGSLGYGSLGWEAGQGHLEPPHTPHPQRLIEVRHPWAPYNFSKYARQAGPPAFKAQPSPLPNLLSKDYRCSPPCPAFDL